MNSLKQCQTEQAWIYSNLLGRRQFINIHVFPLNDKIKLICFTNAHFSQLITLISECIENFNTKIAPNFHKISNFKANTKKTFCQKFLFQNNLLNQKLNASNINKNFLTNNNKQLYCKNIIIQTNELLEKIYLIFENLKIFEFKNQTISDDFIYLGNINRTKKLIKVKFIIINF